MLLKTFLTELKTFFYVNLTNINIELKKCLNFYLIVNSLKH